MCWKVSELLGGILTGSRVVVVWARLRFIECNIFISIIVTGNKNYYHTDSKLITDVFFEH